ncbi:hypothetical protein BEL04_10490 [Mucilaginibacter sp. PPCGB 2223]|uniref:hypothetical protein n=1 Tax=Mucilaginibacter sp. PPCGB 2223 TaxID=1886027 RepID=UPI000826A647|nr:hypothetical protein [Mucilaginibacter sp. PPCGB 2223]OCX54646.1 hypothetical protein BEL04_10490 [Mucilaginibacter sp. PPCGB 2223]
MSQLSEIKCPVCAQWSNWTGKVDAKCPHCGAQLEPEHLKYEQEKKARTEQTKESSYLIIKDTDDTIVQMGKQFVNWLRWSTFFGISVIYFFVALMILVFGVVALV